MNIFTIVLFILLSLISIIVIFLIPSGYFYSKFFIIGFYEYYQLCQKQKNKAYPLPHTIGDCIKKSKEYIDIYFFELHSFPILSHIWMIYDIIKNIFKLIIFILKKIYFINIIHNFFMFLNNIIKYIWNFTKYIFNYIIIPFKVLYQLFIDLKNKLYSIEI